MSKKLNTVSIIVSVISLCMAGACLFFVLTDSKDDKDKTEETEKSMQYVMYVGTNDKDTYKPEHTQEEALRIVDDVCLSYFEGYTIQEATGSWKDEDGITTHEYTIVCYFDDTDKETVYKAADDIIRELNQNTVLIESDTVSIDFYSGK